MKGYQYLVAGGLLCFILLLAACTDLGEDPKKKENTSLPTAAVSVIIDDTFGKVTIDNQVTVKNLLFLLQSAEPAQLQMPIPEAGIHVTFAGLDGTNTSFILHEGMVWTEGGAVLRGSSAERFVIAVEALLGSGAALARQAQDASHISITAQDEGLSIILTPEQRQQLAGYMSRLRRVYLDNPLGGVEYPALRITLEAQSWSHEFDLLTIAYGRISGRLYALPEEMWSSVLRWLALKRPSRDTLAYLFQAETMRISADLGGPVREEYTFETGREKAYLLKIHSVVRLLLKAQPDQSGAEKGKTIGSLMFTVHGQTREVKLMADGFEYEGRRYRMTDLPSRIRAILTAG